HFVGLQRFEVVAARYALLDLSEVGSREEVVQFRLSDQDDLQQLAIGIEIQQKPNLFEHVGGQMLRFVEHQDRMRVHGRQRMEELLKHPKQSVVAGLRDFLRVLRQQSETVENLSKQVVGGFWWRTNEGDDGPGIPAFADGPAKGGLARTDRGGHYHDL